MLALLFILFLATAFILFIAGIFFAGSVLLWLLKWAIVTAIVLAGIKIILDLLK